MCQDNDLKFSLYACTVILEWLVFISVFAVYPHWGSKPLFRQEIVDQKWSKESVGIGMNYKHDILDKGHVEEKKRQMSHSYDEKDKLKE